MRTSTAGRQPIFLDVQLGRIVVSCLRHLHECGCGKPGFRGHAGPFAWLFRLTGESALDKVMHSLKRHSARTVNLRRGVAGASVWQDGYFDRALRAEEDIRAVARYIVANPLRAKLCRHVGDYPL